MVRLLQFEMESTVRPGGYPPFRSGNTDRSQRNWITRDGVGYATHKVLRLDNGSTEQDEDKR